MTERRVTVWVQAFKDRPNLVLQWHDPDTGKRRSETAGTADPDEARYKARELERRLNAGGGTTTTRRRRRTTRGYVYLVEGDEGCFKIGKSVNPEGRLSALNTGFHGDLDLVHRIRTHDMGWLEGLLHRKFAGRRARGEWFLLGSEDVDRLRRVAVWDRGFPPLVAVAIVDDPWYTEA